MIMKEFKNRINKILDYLGVSNYRIAVDLGISQSTIANYRNGKSAPNAPNMELISNYLEQKGASKEWFLMGKGDMIKSGQQSKPETIKTKNGNKYHELPDGTYDVEVALIPFSAYASYVESYETGHVDEDFGSVVFNVDHAGKGNYKAFIVRGDSMNGGKIDDTKDGAKVLGRELQKSQWRDGFNPTEYGWIILCKQNIFHKDIIDFDRETGTITCHSRNQSPEYADFELKLDDCYQIFKVIKRIF